MTTFWVYHENLPIEVEKHVEGRITRVIHSARLSY